MKKKMLSPCPSALLIGLLALLPVFAIGAVEVSQSLEAGYMGDIGGVFRLRVGELSEELPFFIGVGIGFVYQFDSGDATAARAIFINDNTGGVIEKHGENFVFTLDVGYPFSKKGRLYFEPYLGARYNRYKAYYSFIGNNEAFTVRSNQWGLALGARLKLPISKKGDFVYLNGGGEYYFKAPLLSHGTFYYNPDGKDERPRPGYDYDDADDAVKQPRFRPVLALGVQFAIRRN